MPNNDKIAYRKSEPDNDIYNAWNKAGDFYPEIEDLSGVLSLELSATMISPSSCCSANTLTTFSIQAPIVPSSFIEGMTTDTSTISVLSFILALAH
jgi:hypothetical protein